MSATTKRKSRYEIAGENESLSITDLLARANENQPLFILNTSDLRHILEKPQPRGDLIIPLKSEGDEIIIKIPNTWIPIDVTTFAPRNAILNSPHFRRQLESGRIRAISAEAAKRIMQEPGAVEEARLHILNTSGIYSEGTLNDVARRTPEPVLSDSIRNRVLAAGDPTEKAQVPVVNLVNREGITTPEMLNGLRNIEETLTREDLHYIISTVNATTHEAVIKWATERAEEFGG